MERHANVITDAEGKKLVLINDVRFKGKERGIFVTKYLVRRLSLLYSRNRRLDAGV